MVLTRKIHRTYLFQGFLRTLQSRDIVPPNIGLLRHNGTRQSAAQLLLVRIIPRRIIAIALTLGRRPPGAAVLIQLILFLDIVRQFLRPIHISLGPIENEFLARRVLLVFQAQRKALQGVAIQSQGFFVIAFAVGGDGLLDNFDPLWDHGIFHG
jgi:hypothetical protein